MNCENTTSKHKDVGMVCNRCDKEFETPNTWLDKELCPHCGTDDITTDFTNGEEKPKKAPKPNGEEKK
jgi:rRNA maturation endonuclease Nob1